MYKIFKIVVLGLAALLAVFKFVLVIVGLIDRPGKKAWRDAEKGIVDFFFDRCKEILRS